MKSVSALLLSLLGLICIIFNRFVVEESFRLMPTWYPGHPPVWFARTMVILAGIFFVLFGLLMAMGYLR